MTRTTVTSVDRNLFTVAIVEELEWGAAARIVVD
jgi:hypothetical protein